MVILNRIDLVNRALETAFALFPTCATWSMNPAHNNSEVIKRMRQNQLSRGDLTSKILKWKVRLYIAHPKATLQNRISLVNSYLPVR